MFVWTATWGSRPRLNICRRSAARPHDSIAVEFVVRPSRPHDPTAVEFVVVRASRPHDPTAVEFVARAARLHDSTAVNEVQPGRPHHNIDSGFLVTLTEWSLARSHRPLCRWRSMKSWSHFADHHREN